eukprot:NODE_129_length_16972_cov_2.172643.p6 type:complete len:383 gc:universal NODE_129_length_16972_cov_2.172643:3696-4844(+)
MRSGVIHLGRHYCRVGIINDGKIEVVTDDFGAHHIPSLIYEGDEKHFGSFAKAEYTRHSNQIRIPTDEDWPFVIEELKKVVKHKVDSWYVLNKTSDLNEYDCTLLANLDNLSVDCKVLVLDCALDRVHATLYQRRHPAVESLQTVENEVEGTLGKITDFIKQQFYNKYKMTIEMNKKVKAKLNLAADKLLTQLCATTGNASIFVESLYDGLDLPLNVSSDRVSILLNDYLKVLKKTVGQFKFDYIVLQGGLAKLSCVTEVLKSFNVHQDADPLEAPLVGALKLMSKYDTLPKPIEVDVLESPIIASNEDGIEVVKIESGSLMNCTRHVEVDKAPKALVVQFGDSESKKFQLKEIPLGKGKVILRSNPINCQFMGENEIFTYE